MARLRESLVGRYELLDVVGRGGMGVVYRARDRLLDRPVAVKVLPAERAGDPVFVARFEREGRAAAALNHPNIVSVYDTGTDGEVRFIVMEHVAGRSLAQLVCEQRRLPATQVVRIGSQIAGALAAAHRAGIIHRDIKPANVMLDDSGAVKVLDFGIARALSSTSLTQTAVVLGSAPYLAPEVAMGERADGQSDVYSLGCVLYELLSGRPPFTGEIAPAILHQHTSARPRPPRELTPGVPVALDALVLRMLAKRPHERPTAAQLVTDLESALRGPAAAPTGRLPAEPGRAGWPTAATRRLAPRRDPRHGRWIVTGALAAVAALLLALLASSGGRPHSTQANGPSATSSSKAQTRSGPQRSGRRRSSTGPITVPAAAGALTTLITRDMQTGMIDQHGQDLLGHVQDILSSYQQGHGDDALHKLDDLAKHIADLSAHGDIHPAALGAITSTLGRLRAAILRAGPATGTPAPQDQQGQQGD